MTKERCLQHCPPALQCPMCHIQHCECVLYFVRNTIYSRYSTCDWDTSNKANYNLSERERSLAERLRADAWRTVKSTDQRTRNRQTSNSKRLGKCAPPGGLLLRHFPYLGSPHLVFNLHVLRPCASSLCTPFSFMCFLITSLHLSFGLPIFRCPPTPIFHVLIAISSSVFLSTYFLTCF